MRVNTLVMAGTGDYAHTHEHPSVPVGVHWGLHARKLLLLLVIVGIVAVSTMFLWNRVAPGVTTNIDHTLSFTDALGVVVLSMLLTQHQYIVTYVFDTNL